MTPSWLWHRRAHWSLALEALGWLAIAWIMLEFLPFRQVAQLLRPRVRASSAQPAPDLARIGRIIRAVAEKTPWRSVCFHQAIAAQRILCRRGMAADLHYGVRKQPDGMIEAHVWVTAQGHPVVGCEIMADFVPLTSFNAKV